MRNHCWRPVIAREVKQQTRENLRASGGFLVEIKYFSLYNQLNRIRPFEIRTSEFFIEILPVRRTCSGIVLANIEVLKLRRPISAPRQLLLNVYWFAINMIWGSLLLILMPRQIQSVVSDTAKASILGLVLGSGAIISVLAAPILGALSDRIKLPGGRRKPWIVIGTLGTVLALLGLSIFTRPGDASSLPGWIGSFLCLEFLSNIATAPCSALVADQVPARQHGSAAGWLGLMTMLGIFAGGFTSLLIKAWGEAGVYYLLAVVLLGAMVVTILGVDETHQMRESPPFVFFEFLRGIYTPFRSNDFKWVFLNRFLISMGMFTIQEFMLYYMADVVRPPYTVPGFGVIAHNVDEAIALFLPALFTGATLTALAAGLLSDRIGRKPIIYISSLVMGVTSMVFTFSHAFAFSLLIGIVFGLGYGACDSVSWAMASDALPSPDDHGKDMGIWHAAVVLSQVIATPVAGLLLDNFQTVGVAQHAPYMGYTIIFVIAVVYFILGTICLRQIKRIL